MSIKKVIWYSAIHAKFFGLNKLISHKYFPLYDQISGSYSILLSMMKYLAHC